MQVADAIDIAELGQLVNRYAAALDSGPTDNLMTLFHPEGVVSYYPSGSEEPAYSNRGHAALAASRDAQRKRYVRSVHLVSNHLVTLDGDRASGTALCAARCRTITAIDLVHVVRYVDLFERRKGVWRILEHQIWDLWTEERPVPSPN